MRVRCAITMGDPSGIGPQVIAKALAIPRIRGLADFTVIGDKWVIEQLCRDRPPCLSENKFIDLQNVPRKGFQFGKVKAEYGRAALGYLDQAIALIKDKKIDCLVTAPVNKEAISLTGCKFSGHTGYLARAFKSKDIRMMLFNRKLKVILLTQHIPLKEVPKNITIQEILKTILSADANLKTLFGISQPRIAVCGLNPHASDNGTIGNEEKEKIIPAIAAAKRQKIAVEGPYPADTIFNQAISGKYSCVVCMYHDQGLIPLKLTDFSHTVNITLGLPFARTSPGHGTAFDIAGKNKADPQSFIQAVETAIQCAINLRKASARTS